MNLSSLVSTWMTLILEGSCTHMTLMSELAKRCYWSYSIRYIHLKTKTLNILFYFVCFSQTPIHFKSQIIGEIDLF